MAEEKNTKKNNPNPINSNDQGAKSEVSLKEEAVLKFWQENKIFEKTLEATKNGKEYVFYDGPPFATGTPHYGHIVGGTMKDVIPRYQTMKGNFVRRRWGWDCHGLPAENLVEKELGLKSKKDIENYGIEKFNLRAREMVQEYVADWKVIVPRLGRFVDMENDYRTMDWYYSESVMNIFKTLYDKNLIYEGYKSMQICPRCETTLSNFEVNQGYKDITDISVTVKFELVDEPGTFVLAWTTTPWTLPGNVALAINPEVVYCKVKCQKSNVKSESQNSKLKEGESYILAKERAANVLASEEYEIIEEFKGGELIGKSYKPAFDYYLNDEAIKDRENGWKIYGAEFVTTEDGTGIVHIAPAFGEDDMKLGQQEKLPFIQHVSMDGRFKPEVKDWAGELVKPKSAPGLEDEGPSVEAHQAMDIKILKYLAGKGILFSKEKIVHSYPHCWRCGTPLLNYATSSWFVEVTKIRNDLVANNKTVGWTPEHVKEGRFGKWLEGARDWAISRSRFWGAPIPVWRCEDCKKIKVVGSVEELKDNLQNNHNNYFLMRHGEAENNLSDTIDCKLGREFHLTEKGREQVQTAGEELKKKNIDLIISSPFTRTKETAELVAEIVGLSKESVVFDLRLGEYNVGDADGGNWLEYDKKFSSKREKLLKSQTNGESCLAVKRRMGEVLYELNKKYAGKNILIVSHSLPLFFMSMSNDGLNNREIEVLPNWGSSFKNAEIKNLNFQFLPHNENYELDLHRPFIDEIELPCSCGGKMKRVLDVFDCWFESGSMPYAQSHYPFENEVFDPIKGIGFPADFIAEGLDQTRGWFYSMLVLSTALFGQSSYKNVVANGLVLAEDGQKMSKSLKNYPDPMELVGKFGADALRFYLLSSPVMRAEDLNFSEKGVGDIYRKIIMRLNNVYSFYEMYAPKDPVVTMGRSENILDIWISARFNELVTKATEAMEKYEIDKATRPIDEFIDDLSNWYLRRSRDRFKSDDVQDKNWAIFTTNKILNDLSKILAPFTPFIAEDIYLKTGAGRESVHLESWPVVTEFDQKIISDMAQARGLVEMGLALRDKEGLKVRQPISELLISSSYQLGDDFLSVIADEVNAKQVKNSELASLPSERYIIYTNAVDGKPVAALNYHLTDDLRAEGEMRELMRNIQELRKKAGLNPGDVVNLKITTDELGQILINKFTEEIKRGTGVLNINLEAGFGEVKIGESSFGLEIVK